MTTAPELFVACTLPVPAQAPFADRFPTRFNAHGRTLSLDELVEGCAAAVGLVVTATDRLDRHGIDRLPAPIRAIATYSVGHEHVDLPAAHRRGIAVLSTPDVLSESCADTAILLMLGAARRVVEGLDLVRSGAWTGWTPLQLLGHDVFGRRLGILGMGRIGRAVARRARGFGMAVGYHNRTRLPDDLAAGATFYPALADMLPHSDFLCIACPSTPQTSGLVGAELLAALPDGAIVANISRGDVVDDDALVAALRTGKLAGAGLDVFRNEPAIHPAYRTLPNVFALPHIGSSTTATRVAMARLLSDGLADFFAGRPVPNRIA